MIAFNDRDKVFNVVCKLCGSEHGIWLNKKDFDDWQNNNGYIQDLLDYLTSSERELLISATCDDCWKRMYGDEDGIDN
jgi:hypothetical protein